MFLCPKRGKWVIFGAQINFSSCLNLCIRFNWSCIWYQALRSSFKWLIWICKDNSYYAQNEVNGQIDIFAVSQIYFLDFSEIVHDDTH